MYYHFLYLLVIVVSTNFITSANGQRTNPISQPNELGDVAWYRNLEEAKLKAVDENKPILILFQEVPGCSTCKNYGDNVLSHPLIVDIIENEFIPLAIYNNKGGADSEVLKLYKEPSWNNPVLRVIRSDGKNIVTRHAGHYDASSLASYMKLALVTYNGKVPEYVDVLLGELSTDANSISKAYYSMYCFWTGEAKLGQLEGVVSTSPGFMNGREVVKVNYDNTKTNYKKISKVVKSDKFSFVTDPSKFRIDKDPQYYLKRSAYKYLPLSYSQRTKINSAISSGDNPDIYLSPTQQDWKNKIDSQKGSINMDPLYNLELLKAWKICQKKFSSI